jgi:DNA-binding LacI/PurR family transcriptional regulator
MGETAALILLQRLQGFKDYPAEFAVPPQLIIRESSGSASSERRLR